MKRATSVEWPVEGIGRVLLDVPDHAVNVLSEDVLNELSETLQAAAERPGTRALVLASGKAAGFCAGADVNRIAAVTSAAEGARLATLGQTTFARIERLRVPVVAAVHGACFGGGLEMALACHGVIASDDPRTQLALPEVQLGIVPGFGGTQRLPRRIGLVAALDAILTGKRFRAKSAKRVGLVDDVVCPFKLQDEAIRYARELADGKPQRNAKARRGLMRALEKLSPVRRLILRQARSRVLARTRGLYPAPLRALAAIERAFDQDRSEGLRLESEAVGELLQLGLTHRLVDLFLTMEELKREAGDAAGIAPQESTAVIGAGVMGAGIAHVLIDRKARVRLIDVSRESLQRGLAAVAAEVQKDVSRGRKTPHDAARTLDLLSGSDRFDGLNRASIVIEAVVERPDVKRTVFAQVLAQVAPNALVASNTSSLAIESLGAAVDAPGRIVGLHFFNPVEKMPLVEVVAPAGAPIDHVRRAAAIARDLGKTPVIVKDTPGFLVNRVLAPYFSEAMLILEEGLAAQVIDEAMLELGFAMGPLAVLDTVGLDVAGHAAESLRGYLGSRLGAPRIGALLVETRHLGGKSGGGIFVKDGRRSRPAPWLEPLLERARRERGIARSAPAKDAARERMLLLLLNEAASAFAEGCASKPQYLDAAMVLGSGFPPVLGGPLREIDRRGGAALVARLRELAAAHGPRFAPVDALVKRAESGDRYYADASPAAPDLPREA